jgi:Tol biopolymer transport system component
VADADGTNPRQLSFLESPVTAAKSWSPDGQRLAFMAQVDGFFRIYVVDAIRGGVRRLSRSHDNEFTPTWSRDGRWVYFNSARSGRREIWKVLANGGEAVPVTLRGGIELQESPDGRFLYFSRSTPSGGPPGIWRMPAGGGDETRVLDSVAGSDWAMFDRGICFVNRTRSSGATIDVYDFATGEIRTVVSMDEAPWPTGIAVSPDGRWILYAKDQTEADIMVVENLR